MDFTGKQRVVKNIGLRNDQVRALELDETDDNGFQGTQHECIIRTTQTLR